LQQQDFQPLDIEVDENDTLDTSHINRNASYNDDYNAEVVPSLFEDHITNDYFRKSSLEFYHAAPNFDKYMMISKF